MVFNLLYTNTGYRGRIPTEVGFLQRSDSYRGRIPTEVGFLQRSDSYRGRIPTEVGFLQRSDSYRGRIPDKNAIIIINLLQFQTQWKDGQPTSFHLNPHPTDRTGSSDFTAPSESQRKPPAQNL